MSQRMSGCVKNDWTVFRAAEESEMSKRLSDVQVAGNHIEGVLEFDIAPAEFVVSLFTELDARGVPTSDIGDEVDCLNDKVRCHTSVKNGKLHFRLGGVRDAKIAVLHLGYMTLLPKDSGIEPRVKMETGTWGVRVRSSESNDS